MNTFDVTYTVTRAETYRVEARSKQHAREIAFEEGALTGDGGETFNVEPIQVDRVASVRAGTAKAKGGAG
jgi:hypothetical protein